MNSNTSASSHLRTQSANVRTLFGFLTLTLLLVAAWYKNTSTSTILSNASPQTPPTTQANLRVATSTDPRLSQPRDVAQKSWLEFIAAFNARQVGNDYFAVLAPVQSQTNLEIEHLWIEVDYIHHTVIFGRLVESPTIIKSASRGESVSLLVSQITDWEYINAAGNHQGYFSASILPAIRNRRNL